MLRRFLFLLLPPLSLAVLAASLPWVHGAVAGDRPASSPSTRVSLTPAQREALSSTPTLAEAETLEAAVRSDIDGLQRAARDLTARRAWRWILRSLALFFREERGRWRLGFGTSGASSGVGLGSSVFMMVTI